MSEKTVERPEPDSLRRIEDGPAFDPLLVVLVVLIVGFGLIAASV